MRGQRYNLYEKIADNIAHLVTKGTFRTGDRIPSIRIISRKMKVSVATALEAYRLLEDRGIVEARPQSGYYVRALVPGPVTEAPATKTDAKPTDVSINDIVRRVLRSMVDPGLLQLGPTIPNPELLPVKKLSSILASVVRTRGNQSLSYMVRGYEKLRVQIARRSLLSGCRLAPDDILVTTGCQEAIMLSLRALCRPGDTVIIESPAFFNHLQAIETLGLKVIEIPSNPSDGISLETVAYVLEEMPVKACLLVPNFSNPNGSLMPDEKKKALLHLLYEHDVPLIEDDIYGDLSFSSERPGVVKSFDEKGLVVLCSSFSKTLAPGYRVGWVASSGSFRERIEHQKFVNSFTSATPPQMAIAEFLSNGGYDHHLRRIRRILSRNVESMRSAVGRHFPLGTRVTRPTGAFFLWVEMPERIDALELYEMAVKKGITIAPGLIFSTRNKYRNYIRLNAAVWSQEVERAIAVLGDMAKKLASVPQS